MAEAATYTAHKKHKRRTSMHSAGFEPAIPTMKMLQTLDRKATGISKYHNLLYRITFQFHLPYHAVFTSLSMTLRFSTDTNNHATPCLTIGLLYFTLFPLSSKF